MKHLDNAPPSLELATPTAQFRGDLVVICSRISRVKRGAGGTDWECG